MSKGNVFMVAGACGLAGLCALTLGCKRESEAGYERFERRAVSPVDVPGVAPTRSLPPPAPVIPTGTSTAAETAAAQAPTDQYAAETLAALHQDNQNEIQLGKVAQEMGQASAVKEYGAMLVHHHTQADEKLVSYATSKNLPLDRAETARQKTDEGRQAVAKLRTVEGNAFDRMFAVMMVNGHQKALDLVNAASSRVADPDLKALLGELAPTLKEHLQQAKTLATTSSRSSATEEPAPGTNRTQGRRPVGR